MALPYTLIADDPIPIGLIVLQSDESIETDLHRMKPAGVNLLVSRVPSAVTVSSETLAEMANHLTEAASRFPTTATFHAIGYGCTSGTAQIGVGEIARLVQAGTPTPHVTEPVSALIAACKALNLKRLALISPYVEDVSARLREVLNAAGITVTGLASFDEAEEARVARIAPASLIAAATQIAETTQCDGIFLSCTNLRTLDVIADIEAVTGKPVLSSNQVLAWHLFRLANAGPAQFAPGALWTT